MSRFGAASEANRSAGRRSQSGTVWYGTAFANMMRPRFNTTRLSP